MVEPGGGDGVGHPSDRDAGRPRLRGRARVHARLRRLGSRGRGGWPGDSRRRRRRSHGGSLLDDGSGSGSDRHARRLRRRRQLRRLRRRRRRGCGRSRRGGSRGRGDGYPLARREEAQRVEVPVLVVRPPDAEVHVRRVRDRVRALADAPDAHALRNGVAAPDRDARELEESHGEAVTRLDRQRAAAVRDRARERDGAANGRVHGVANGRADVDPAMLAARVGVIAEDERAQDRPVDRPRPRTRGSRERERPEHDDD